MKRLLFLMAGGLLAVPARAQPADPAADPDKQACFDAFESSQDLRDQQKLLAARETLEKCAASTCPEAVRTKCVGWAEEVRQGIPTIVVSAVDASGAQQTDFAVFVDGEQRATALNGQPLEVDPGTRTIRIERPDSPPLEKSVLANHGQKSQLVQFDLGGPPAGPIAPPGMPPPSPQPVPDPPPDEGMSTPTILGITALGVGGAALVVGAITGGVAMSKGSDLDDVCTDGTCPSTSADDYDTGTTMADVSTVTFILGGVLAATGVTLIVVGASDSAPTSSAEVRAVVGPTSGAIVGTF